MTSTSDAGATPANVAAQATIAAVLERNDISLIGKRLADPLLPV